MSTFVLLAVLGCGSEPGGHGHDHGPRGSHPPHGEEDGAAPIAITRWTDDHELFIELDAPVAGQPFRYKAHVTKTTDNHPATAGSLSMRMEADGSAAASHTDVQVARDGVFADEANAPTHPGTYRLIASYTNAEERAEWDAGPVAVGSGAPLPHEAEAEGEITFLKETQWRIPFAVAPAARRPLSPILRATAVVSAAPGQSAVVDAPVDGLLAWSEGLPIVGRRVARGERLAALVPAGAAESWSRLQADLSTARVDLALAEQDLARVRELRARDLLPERRLQEAQAAVQHATAELSVSQDRVVALTSERSGAMPILAPAAGLVVAVVGAHGERVDAGTPLVTVATGDGVMLQGRVHDRARTELDEVTTITVHRGDWATPRQLPQARVLTERLVFDARTLSAPLTVLADDPAGLSVGDLVTLEIGVGEATPRLAVPRSAVVEVNAQDVVFVQMSGETFTRRRVTLGLSDPTHIEVLTGLQLGDRVVVLGGFDVHVASMSAALASHKH